MQRTAAVVVFAAALGCAATVDTSHGAADGGSATDLGAAVDAPATPPSDGATGCPTAPGEDSRPCANPGFACTVEPACGRVGFACVCAATNLWTCAVIQSHCDGGTGGGGTPEAGTCSLVGTWRFQLPGDPSLVIQFLPGGTWQAAATSFDLGGSDITGGTFTLDGDQIALTEGLVAVSPTGCSAGQVGRYTLAFAADCAALTLTLASDPCVARGRIFNGLQLTPL